MTRLNRCLWAILLIVVCVSGCKSYESSSDRNQRRMNQTQDKYGAYFTQMRDNAILRDMSLAEFHFIPHSAELSGVGVARLDRMASMLNVYGGTVNYVAREADQSIVDQRLEHVREYLSLTGCDMDRVTVKVGLSGGDGGPATEAVAAYRASQTGAMSGGASGGSGAMGGMSAIGNLQGNK